MQLKNEKFLLVRFLRAPRKRWDIEIEYCLGNVGFSVVPRALFLFDGEPLRCTGKANLIHLILIKLSFIEENDISDKPGNQR